MAGSLVGSTVFAARRFVGVYRQVFILGVQNTLVYRWNFLLRSVVSVLPLVATYFLWGAAFAGRGTVGGYTYPQMMAYYFSLVILDSFTSPTEDDFQIAGDIRDGQINQVLLKPLNYFLYRFILFASSRMVYVAVAAVPLGLFVVCLRHFFAGIPFAQTLAPAALAFLGSALVQFSFSYMVGLVAFWLLDVGSIVFMLFSLEFLLGGHVFPLDLLPEPWHHLVMATPFAYEYFFPVAVLLGRVSGAALWWGFLWQAAWAAGLIGLSAALWKLGLRKYTAVGG